MLSNKGLREYPQYLVRKEQYAGGERALFNQREIMPVFVFEKVRYLYTNPPGVA